MLPHPRIQVGIDVFWRSSFAFSGGDYGTIGTKFHSHFYTSPSSSLEKALCVSLSKFGKSSRHLRGLVCRPYLYPEAGNRFLD
jgi:hypothetical protein